MSAKQINLILAVLLAFALVSGIVFAFKNFGLRRDLGTTGGQLKRAYRVIDDVRDSLHVSEVKLKTRDKYWEDVHKQDIERVTARLKQVSKKEIRYEKTFVTPPPAWDQRQLDSLRRAIIARGYRRN